MPLRDRRFHGYTGPLTAERWRCAVVARAALAEVFATRLPTVAFVLACLPPLGFLAVIYFVNNLEVLQQLRVDLGSLLAIDGNFFFVFLTVQVFFAFGLTVLIGPALVAPDLLHDALPLYLSRPLSRSEYVAGKLAAIAALLSAVTWIPGLVLFAVQASLAGWTWTRDHAFIPWGLFVGSVVWVVTVALVALAVSAWVRLRPLASAAILGVFLVGAGFGRAIEEVLDLRWGRLLAIDDLHETIWAHLFHRRLPDGSLSLGASLCGVGLFCAVALLILARRIRGREVAR